MARGLLAGLITTLTKEAIRGGAIVMEAERKTWVESRARLYKREEEICRRNQSQSENPGLRPLDKCLFVKPGTAPLAKTELY